MAEKDPLEKRCDRMFGPNGEHSKAYALKEGNAIFDSFMSEMAKVPDSNSHKAAIVSRAKARRYHDYEGDLMKMGLVADLQRAGLDDLADRVMDGDFDF